MAVGVAHRVDHQSSLAPGLSVLGGDQPWLTGRGQCGHAAGGRTERVKVGVAAHRHDDVVATGSGGHRPRLEPQLAQHLPTNPGSPTDVRRFAVAAVQVEYQPVRAIEPVGAAQPGMQRDAGLVGEVDERGGAASQPRPSISSTSSSLSSSPAAARISST